MTQPTRRAAHSVAFVLLLLVLASGCAKQVPQEVSDLNRTLGQAKDSCASVYAADELAAIDSDIDEMNALIEDGKYRKAKKKAMPLMPKIEALAESARSGREAAKRKAEASMAKAQSAFDQAQSAEASQYASSEQRTARSKLDEARSAMNDPCRYNDAASLADEAARLADTARRAAVEGKRRAEEEARRRAEEEERRRREAEEAARRRAEEERLRMFPPSYTVQRGDSLWRIAGRDNIYKKSALWVVIYDANRGAIADPDLIYPGQELKIVRGMSEAEMTDKMRRLWRELAE